MQISLFQATFRNEFMYLSKNSLCQHNLLLTINTFFLGESSNFCGFLFLFCKSFMTFFLLNLKQKSILFTEEIRFLVLRKKTLQTSYLTHLKIMIVLTKKKSAAYGIAREYNNMQ